MRKLLMPVLLVLGATAAEAATPSVVKRVVITSGRQSGSQVTTTAADGSLTIAFDVLQNGRGPHVDATLRLAADGTIESLTASGHHEMGTKVAETFSRKGNHVSWKSEEEQGERDLTGPAFFVPMADLPEVIGLLARAALKAGGTLPILPGGTARIEKTVEVTLTGGGAAKKVVGYAITGLELEPTYLWMNEDGSWFGYVSPWFSVVPEGFEGSIEMLIDKQKELSRARDAKIASANARRPPAAGRAFTHARVLDVVAGKWLPDQTVVVVGDTITAVGPSAKQKVPPGAEVVDLGGKALLPGLWDMHSHLDETAGVLAIASGVTTARDVGNDPERLDEMKGRFDAGTAVGPHVLRFGFIEGRNEKAAASKITAETPDEAKAAVAYYVKRGWEGVKIYNSVRPELVPIIAREAHAHGLPVTGHIPVHMLAHEAVEAGYDGIEHINMLFLNFFASHETDTRDTTRFTLVGDKAAGLDLGGKPVADFIKLLKAHKTVICPTLDAFEDMFVGEPGKVIPGLESIVGRLPAQTQRFFLLNGLPDRSKAALYRESYLKLLAMVKLLRDRGVTVVVGTDTIIDGLMMHHELALFVRAGIPTAEALRMATIIPARTLKRDDKSGSIAAGKAADLVVVDGDPLADIADISHVVSTMRGGVVYPSAALYTALGVQPFSAK